MNQTGQPLKIIWGVTDDGGIKFIVTNMSTTVKANITHGTIAFSQDITVNSNGVVDIDTGFKVNGDLSKYCIIERFSGAWAFVTINKFISGNGTLKVTILNPTTSNISQSNAYFVYDWIKFLY